MPVLLAFVATLWWLRHGDQLKATNPFAGFLRSSELTEWNWGTWAQRTSGEVWKENWFNISQSVLGAVPLAVLLFGAALVEPRYRRVAAWGTLFFLSGPLLFTFLVPRCFQWVNAAAGNPNSCWRIQKSLVFGNLEVLATVFLVAGGYQQAIYPLETARNQI